MPKELVPGDASMLVSERRGECIKDCIVLAWFVTTDRLLLMEVIFGRRKLG